ncbi:MAG: phage tail sheath subtilisin-like domain-containing protein [Pseudomonadota bacterium]
MPISPTYPGVYIQEIDSGVRTVAGVATSIAAFVGRTKKGPVNEPIACFNMGEFNRTFGGLYESSNVSYAVDDFFANGGGQCLIVRLFEDDTDDGYATLTVGGLSLRAKNPGKWGSALKARVIRPDTNPDILDPEGTKAAAALYGLETGDIFDLEITDTATGTVELFRTVAWAGDSGQRRVDNVLKDQSALVEWVPDSDFPNARPADAAMADAALGNDGQELTDGTYEGHAELKTGIEALRKADIFNLLCIPPDTRVASLPKTVREKAALFCAEKRALYIVDPPNEWDEDARPIKKALDDQRDATNQVISLTNARNAALYFPRIEKRDPLNGGQIARFAPCGAVAGVMARTDVNRGVFKAPAGIQATVANAHALAYRMTDQENGQLNPIAVNCMRSFPNIGRVVWGARTLAGLDVLSDDYKYVSVRRLALFIEESLFRGTQWVVFEGNDEPLWAQVRLSVGSFMQRLFLQGAFQGSSPKDAYFVKCDSSTTTQDDINRGIVNIAVGFAPLQPAEFVIITIQQIRSAS